jgi:lantibiotic modifying enzyme
MLFDPARHEGLLALRWSEGEARVAIERIVADTEARFVEGRYWPPHPLDCDDDADRDRIATSLYDGACGVFWALHYLEALGTVRLRRNYLAGLDQLLERNRARLGKSAERERASFLMGDTPIRVLSFGAKQTIDDEHALAGLIAGNARHPARDLMWGAAGTLLAALFLYERTGSDRWAELFRSTADALRGELEWSPRHRCSYWTQELGRWRSTYLDAVHGFVATALPLIRGRHLLDAEEWAAWERCVVNTVRRTADREGGHVNWRPELDDRGDSRKKLMQFCHGAPGFVICLAGLPGAELDDLLVGAGETIWAAGPLAKGSNLCHGTGGNGYAFLKLFERTRDSMWLERARAFAMHGIAQTEQHARRYRQLRYSLWTGDVGFAIYLADCVRAEAKFPTLDVFFGPRVD